MMANRRQIGRINLPATVIATTALWPAFAQGDVPEFTGETGRPAHQLAIQNNANANSFRNGHREQVAHAFRVPAEPEFGKRAGVGFIFQVHRQAGGILEPLL